MMAFNFRFFLRLALVGLLLPVGAGLSLANAIKPWAQISDASQRFVVLTDFGGDAVLDRATGLIWDRTPEGGSFDWYIAQRRCIFVANGGNTPLDLGWRLPKVEELYSLFRVTGGNPGGPTMELVPGHPFTLPAATTFWTASTVPLEGDPNNGWIANTNGNFGFNAKDEGNGVWCVRGGVN